MQAVCLAKLHRRGRRLRPMLEDFTKSQWEQIQQIRARMSPEADAGGDGPILDRVGQVCGHVQQELWLQLNSRSMAAASASVMPRALMLTDGGHSPMSDPFSGALAAHDPSTGGAQAVLEPELHLPRTSPLLRPINALLELPPYKLLQAFTQLARDTRNNLIRQLGAVDLLSDARRRCEALGIVVDPMHNIRMMQQVEGHRAMYAAARASYEALRRDAAAQEPLMEELSRLEETAQEKEREEARLGSIVSLLMESEERVLREWQEHHQETREFLHNMLPATYDELIDVMGQNTDRLSRSVAELMRVPAELLPVLAEQRRIQRLQGGTGAAHDGMAADRLKSLEHMARWLAAYDGQLRSRQRDLTALGPTIVVMRERLQTKRQIDQEELLAPLVRCRKDMMTQVHNYVPRVERAMRDSEEQSAARLVPWQRVNGLTAAETLDEIRSLFARMAQLQQPHPPLHEHIYGGASN
ncbi:hypothetical protein GPECTOR_11g159 [Gonium pectorale]|uniref:Uncharacterized protein n=1 Tax=Gonium pectorale TaxID=33097 RepID=A0A150GQT3_GONPE|nr:hypothetical protein GPECTOR_11g159 [Gonium pectorale]|eukprot:KXZ51710.1 hypothetical protein GPECTOR_11g159 [Gonium pectorale]